jgi:deazaflavin-dependent oxidoreductase (nitroreductase family)
MDLLEAMRTTFAAREFSDAPVPDDALMRILDDARFAPSGGNRQGWRVIVVRADATKRALAELAIPTMRRYFAQVAAGESPWNTIHPTKLTQQQIDATPVPARVTETLAKAPVLLVVCIDLSLAASLDSELPRIGVTTGASVYPFVWSLLLAANAEGLGGTLTTFCVGGEPQMQRLLGIPAHFAVAAVVPIGVPAKRLTQLKRRPVAEFAVRERFDGEPFAPARDEPARAALARDRVVEITTRGRKSGAPRRIEIWLFRVGDRFYLTGSPGRARHWVRNLAENPRFTLHLKESARADLPAFARIVAGAAERRRVLARILEQIDGNTRAEWVPGASAEQLQALRESHARIAANRAAELPRWEAESPLVEVRM